MHHLIEHWGDVLTGAVGGVTLWSILAFAVNTAPTPSGAWGQWVLGIIKFAVGQKLSAMNAIRGNETMVVEVPRGSGGVQTAVSSSAAQSNTVEVTPQSIIITDNKQAKTTIPNPAPPAEPKP